MSKVSKVVVFLVVGALIGLVIGFVITRAQAAQAATGNNVNEGGGYSLVQSSSQGVRKYRAGMLGHVQGNIQYPAVAKRKIVSALLHEAVRQNGPHSGVTGAALWSNFTAHDNCAVSWQPGGGGSVLPGYYTCQHSLPRGSNWSGVEVRGYICSGLAGIAVVSTSGFALVGVGAGWSACMWEGALEAAARN